MKLSGTQKDPLYDLLIYIFFLCMLLSHTTLRSIKENLYMRNDFFGNMFATSSASVSTFFLRTLLFLHISSEQWPLEKKQKKTGRNLSMSFHLTTCCCVYFPLVIHHWLAPVILLILSHFSNESKTKDIICRHSTSTPAPVVCGALGQSSPPCHTSKGGKWKVLHTHTQYRFVSLSW